MDTAALSTQPSKKTLRSWASFDFANSSFAVIMVTFVFPIYYRKVIVQDGNGLTYWANTLSASMLLVALLTPLLGAMADILRNKKTYLAIFTTVSIACTAAIFFVPPGMVLVASILFMLANAGFEGGLVFYDAFLPEITSQSTFGKISGYGFAVGYIGSLITLIINLPLLTTEPKYTFLTTAAFFLLFSIPFFLFVPEKRKETTLSFTQLVSRGFKELFSTIRKVRQYKNVARFLLAFFIYNDAILTVIGFSGTYAENQLHFGMIELALFFAMIQIIAVLGSIVFGKLTDERGPKLSITLTLFIWIAVVIGAYFATTKHTFFIVGGFAGVALGSSQASSRSFMALLTPKEHTAEFFGFYDGFCGKASAIVGPFVFGWLAAGFGEREAIVSLAVFFVAGLITLNTVRHTPNELSAATA